MIKLQQLMHPTLLATLARAKFLSEDVSAHLCLWYTRSSALGNTLPSVTYTGVG